VNHPHIIMAKQHHVHPAHTRRLRKSLITIRSWWASGFEMTWIGALEGVVTYVIGIGLGKLGGG
jgi:hypothetical protein